MSVDAGDPHRGDWDALDELAAGYVLGTLSAAQREDVARRLPQEPGLQDRVDAWEARLHALSALAEPVTPAPRVWSAIARSIGHAEQRPTSATSATVRPGWWHSLALWRGIAFGATACSLLLAAMLGLRAFAPPAPPRYVVVLAAPQDKTPGWLIQASSPRRLKLIPLGAQAAPTNRALQFWTKADDWSGPVSLGLVQANQSLDVALDRLPALQDNQLFEITLEPAAGSPIGRPTGPVLYIGRAVLVR
ncbi:anti-sigma factor domain-containing protein [Cupriavidus campinensis]|uniref:Regulator of SigK n=1 Tax=Cupriavidus campinensis TaxID=151783 RepID=A0AAE9I658_9BURK|nr:anti-sigma factor [Cupriavidus campinensis]URF08019.1 anti-sigma factor [Cupriavidus campinensis]